MGLYEGIKDVAKIVQQADNVELYRALLDLSAQALDMQAEIATLKKENQDLQAEIFKKRGIIRHTGIYITLENEHPEIADCSSCYGKDNKLIQMFVYDRDTYCCPVCHTYASKDKS